MIHADGKKKKETKHLVQKITPEIAKTECLIIISVRIPTAVSDVTQFLLHS